MTFGDRLKELRDEKKLTQEDLGKIVNLSKANISKYEKNLVEANNETLTLLADYFCVSVDYLLGRSDIRNPYEDRENKSQYVSEATKTLESDLVDLMIKYGIIKDKDSVNEKHVDFIKYAIETYKNEQNNK